MKKALIILVPGIIFLACFFGYIRNQNGCTTTVIINRGNVFSDKISAEITDVNYDEGWLSGTINIYDESILAYYNENGDVHQVHNNGLQLTIDNIHYIGDHDWLNEWIDSTVDIADSPAPADFPF